MFSINIKKNSCGTKYINTGVKTGIGPNSNLVFSKGVFYTNSPLKTVPNLSCIINSTKEKLTYDIYDAARNNPIPIPFCSGKPFIIQINTSNISSGSTANNQFQLPMISTGKYNFIVEWGDGNNRFINSYNNVTHTYSSPGIYTIYIYTEIL